MSPRAPASKPAPRLPTVRQLRYFVTLADIGHFGRAADACFVSQSAFSIAIRDLESLLGIRLVDRTRRSRHSCCPRPCGKSGGSFPSCSSTSASP
jgi:hypothetical protein